MIELLAPAGDLEKLKIAFLYGADACYIGGKEYSLRANAKNFSIEEIEEACSFAHSLGKKVFVTVNMVFHNEDLDGLSDYLKELEKAEVDAIIVSDPLVLSVLEENNIDLEVHLSTQGSTTNSESVKYWMSKGVKRVVLAREVPACEIKEIIKDTGCDIEVFLHGAMCTCYSGRCVLSNYFTNRDSNRGGCAQVCRFVFDLDKERDIDYSIATKDLNLSSYISDLIEMGVSSIKIEGRMRSSYYIATIISCYRKLIDAYYNNRSSEELVKEMQKRLYRVANRESTSQYFKGDVDVNDQYYIGREEVSNQDFLGFITDYDEENKIVVLEERNYFKKGDSVVIFTPSGEEYNLTLDHIYDENMNEIETANHPKQIIKIKYDKKIEKNSMMRVSF
ncbi:MAG: U32 family peptidase [Bacilli bacterium]|nr:U32 family peptidase [Bacilli bacterium]